MTEIVVDLPFPPSINRLWRVVGRRLILSDEYRAWLANAKNFMLYTGGGKQRLKGHFTYKVILDETERGRTRDGDNFASKAILDLLQSVEVIENDKLADSGSWAWGIAPHGCRVVLTAAE